MSANHRRQARGRAHIRSTTVDDMAENAAVVIKGATIVSMDAEMGTVVGDVLIRDGSISAVGSVDEATARDAERVDARGMILIPGLVDCHRHVWQLPLRSVTANWSLMDYVIGLSLIHI